MTHFTRWNDKKLVYSSSFEKFECFDFPFLLHCELSLSFSKCNLYSKTSQWLKIGKIYINDIMKCSSNTLPRWLESISYSYFRQFKWFFIVKKQIIIELFQIQLMTFSKQNKYNSAIYTIERNNIMIIEVFNILSYSLAFLAFVLPWK